jgi:hypothetical protein
MIKLLNMNSNIESCLIACTNYPLNLSTYPNVGAVYTFALVNDQFSNERFDFGANEVLAQSLQNYPVSNVATMLPFCSS